MEDRCPRCGHAIADGSICPNCSYPYEQNLEKTAVLLTKCDAVDDILKEWNPAS